MTSTRNKITICMIAPFRHRGGVATAARHMYLTFKYLGFNSRAIDSDYLNKSVLSNPFKNCTIIQVNGPQPLFITLKILFAVKAKKILTLHGWVMDEAKLQLIGQKISIFRRILIFARILVNWLFHKMILIPFVYDVITVPSQITALKNGVKALIIKNPVFPSLIERKNPKMISRKNPNEITFITYVSIGGLKSLSLRRLIRLILNLNNYLKNIGSNKRIKLLIFGKDIPESYYNIPNIEFKGYVSDFLNYVLNSDLFIMGYSFPELGYAVLEAGFLGVPIAKYTENPDFEELVDGLTGILARNDEEMLKRLQDFSLNAKKYKIKYGKALRNYLLETYNFIVVGKKWAILIKNLFQ